ncbi:MAG: DJ-1/PfpI family protein [Clostridiales bacterium]|nr:DJ-1/PfpI family protein [Clostridiales bacterium]
MKKVYVFLGDGFETVEALMSVDVLRRGGVDVETVSIMKDIKVLSSHNVEVRADIMLNDADLDTCEMMILPGGLGGTNNIKANHKLVSALKAQAQKGKYVCAICAAPSALGINGILKGKKATVYPGFEDEMKGAEVTGENVTVDGNIITGKGPGMALEFALTLLNTLKGEKVCAEVKSGMLL